MMNARLWTGRLHPMPGGIQLATDKPAAGHAIEHLPLGERLILPLRLPDGSALTPCVKPGQQVARGTLLASGEGLQRTPQHAPTSGRVTALSEHPLPHPSGLPGPCLLLEPDGADMAAEPLPPLPDWTDRPRTELLERLHHAGIAGLGGAGFPTAVKAAVQGASPIEMLLLNGVECEPEICADDGLMRERADSILAGAAILARLVAADYCLIAIEDDKPEALAAMRAATSRLDTALSVEVIAIPSRYPIGGERQLIQVLTGLEVPSQQLPATLGIVCQNVATAAAVAAAVLQGEPLTRRITTVTGAGVSRPRNLDVPLGTPFSDLLQHCGWHPEHAGKLVMGGPMMGFAVADASVPVIKTSNCILVLEPATPAAEQPCIRCGDCAEVCPVQLLPQQLYWHARSGDLERARQFDLADCIECGACAWVCPSRIPLVQYYKAAKGELRDRAREQARAEQARQRFEQREARLTAEAQARELEREQRLQAARERASRGNSGPSAVVAAALARKRGRGSAATSVDSNQDQGADGSREDRH